MEHEFTDTILALIGKLDHIDAIGTFDKLDEDLWGRTGGDTWQELADNLPALVDYLKGEYHQEHKIDPQIDCLRESLQEVITTIEKACQDKPDTVYYDFCRMKYLCADWIKWIDRYFPPDPNGQEPKSEQTRPKKQSKTIKDCILLQDEEQKNELLKVLHSLLDNKLGRFAGLVVAISVKLGLLAKPKFKMLVAEFGDIGNESGFNRYYIIAEKALKGEINTYQKEEISIIKDKFSCFVTQDNSAK